MANRYAVASGNWSNPATWDGGTLPTNGDVVRPNGFTVTIDQDITVSQLRRDASSPAVAGGSFVVDTARTINAELLSDNITSSRLLTVSHASGTVVLNGNWVSNGSGGYLVLHSGAGHVTVTATSLGASNNTEWYTKTGSGSSGDLTVTCPTISGPSATGNAFVFGSLSSGNVVFNGNIVPPASASSGSVMNISGNCAFTINGNVAGSVGSALSDSGAILVGSGVSMTINGNVSGGSGAFMAGIVLNYSTANAVLTINGDATAGSGNSAVVSSTTAHVRINGNQIAHTNGRPAIVARIAAVVQNNLTLSFAKAGSSAPLFDGTLTTFYQAGSATGHPSQEDVRHGTVYGPSSELTGTCRVPNPASVLYGAPVDNTTGTAQVTNPAIIQQTTIATLASQTSFTLTAGSADNDAYNGLTIVVTDASTSTQKCVGTISDYVGSTRTVTLSSDPGIFTMAVGDSIAIIATLSDDVISESKFADDTAKYQAKIWFLDDASNDRYAVVWFKNGEPIVAGITSPTIWVYDTSGADLLGTSGSPQALTQIGATGTYMHDEGTNRVVDGTLYLARVRATIDGSTRTWYQQLGRDA